MNDDGSPATTGQSSMPAGWASQITGTFGDDDTIDFEIRTWRGDNYPWRHVAGDHRERND